MLRRPIFYGWVVVGAAFIAQFVAVGVQTSVSGAFAPPLLETFGWSRTQYFLPDTVGQVVMMFFGLMVGPYIDRVGPRRIMLIGVAVLAPSLFIISQLADLWQWIVLRGIFIAPGAALCGFLLANVTVSKWFVAKRGRALGWTSMGVSAAGVFWPILAALMITAVDWRASWALLSLISLVVLVPMAMLMRGRPEDYGLQPDGEAASISEEQRLRAEHDFRTSLTRREALRTPAFYLIVLIFGASVVGIYAILLNGLLFLQDHGFSYGWAAALVPVMSICSLVTKAPWGWALDRFDSRAVGAISFAIAAAGFAAVVLSADTGSVLVVALAMALLGCGIGGNIPIGEMLWAEYFGRRYLGAVRGLGFPVSSGISAVTPVAIALYFDQIGSYDGAFYACAGLWALCALLCASLRLPAKRQGVAAARLFAQQMLLAALPERQKPSG